MAWEVVWEEGFEIFSDRLLEPEEEDQIPVAEPQVATVGKDLAFAAASQVCLDVRVSRTFVALAGGECSNGKGVKRWEGKHDGRCVCPAPFVAIPSRNRKPSRSNRRSGRFPHDPTRRMREVGVCSHGWRFANDPTRRMREVGVCSHGWRFANDPSGTIDLELNLNARSDQENGECLEQGPWWSIWSSRRHPSLPEQQ